MAFSDIVGGFTKSYLYTNLARDAVRLWNRFGDLDLADFDKERLLRKVGVVPYTPGSRAASDITLFLLGGIVGAVVGLALAPKSGVELRSQVKDRAMNLFDQVKNKAQDAERVTA
ncbi:MAG TPA: YtxH domain-containing protein [Myxococcaceae bacterium]|nr:YtxH domain-containing protein [Myxococcaceae bacterium]